MTDTRNSYYLTTPIYYVNARPHIGHAYSTIVADVLARRHRLLGDQTYFLTGTDEHGQKIERSAAAAGIPPQQFADQVSKTFADLWQRMGITHDQFIRTTSDQHKRGVQQLFRTLYDNGHIYLDSYTGAYCVSDEAFVDAPVGTPCPDCGKLLEQVTEENFFFRLSAFQQPLLDLIESGVPGKTDGLTITPDSARNEVLNFICGNVKQVVEEYNSSNPTEPVSDEPGEDGIVPSGDSGLAGGLLWGLTSGRLKQSATRTCYVAGALRDLSISRSSFTWGVPVPDDIQRAAGATQPHVIYVWLDALANYITALGYGSDDTSLFDTFWPADIHLVGKEITRFHCVYWPAFLLAAGLPTPKQVTANGWLLFDNSKMSKSKGNVVRTETILDAFGTLCPPPAPASPSDLSFRSAAEESASPESPQPPPEPTPHDRDLFAADVLRYYLLREIPFGQDGSFSFDSLITRYNADLANGYGNLVSRTLNMMMSGDTSIPTSSTVGSDPHFMANTANLIANLMKLSGDFEVELEAFSFASALSKAAVMVTLVDGYITQYAPWKLLKSDDIEHQQKAATILYTAAESIRIITALLYPILPYATARVWAQLGLGDIEQAARNGKLKNLTWGGLQPGTRLGPLGPIFPRADKGLAQIMADHEETLATGNSQLATESTKPAEPTPTPAAPAAPPAPELAPEIAIDDFIKLDLRIAEVKVCERIPKADKLLRLEVDLGPLGTRQILSGIAEHYTPEELLGRRILVIANLAPRKMRGLESHGMLLAASEENGKPYLATVPEGVPVGTRLK